MFSTSFQDHGLEVVFDQLIEVAACNIRNIDQVSGVPDLQGGYDNPSAYGFVHLQINKNIRLNK